MSRPGLIPPWRLLAPWLALLLACCGPVQIGRGGTGSPAYVIGTNGQVMTVEGGDRTLFVGPHRALKLPSQATRYVRDGNTVLIDPGEYDDCAVWTASHLTIAARAPGVVFTGKTCNGKGIFIINGASTTVQGISFTHAAVRDHNGAGIRLQAADLTVKDDRFLDNENGILAGNDPTSTVRILDSTFRGNGTCQAACAHGIYVGQVGLLEIVNSHFTDTHEGHDIKSRALRTVLRGNDISDGPDGHASYLVDIPNGGDLLMEHNTLSKGPRADNESTAVAIGEEGERNPTHSLVIRDNRFTNLLKGPTAFVTNRTGVPAELSNNTLTGPVTPLVGPGSVH